MSASTIRELFIIRKNPMLENVKFWRKIKFKEMMRDYIKCIVSPITLRFRRNPKWRKLNMNNLTTLKYAIPVELMKKIKIWNYTYWEIDVRLWWFEWLYIKIWNYVSIAAEVEFICWTDHCTSHLSSYPFWYWSFSYNKNKKDIQNVLSIGGNQQEIGRRESNNKWPIIVDDDVRIWTWAKIMSWVHIWQWAVIAAWAVVTKDVPPYAIVWWVPAKVIKYRFSEDKIKKLLQIDYSNIPIEKFREIYPETIKEDFDIDYILKKLKE